jgi:hypothetical protein
VNLIVTSARLPYRVMPAYVYAYRLHISSPVHPSVSRRYYDDLLLQEGILEAYKIFGKDLIGVEMLVVVNDSLMGPMDLQIYEKWRAVQNQAIISMTVWRNTITTGAGMVFTRGALEHKSFSAFWRCVIACKGKRTRAREGQRD